MPVNIDPWLPVGLGVSAVLTILIALGMSSVVGPLPVWGGTVCETSHGVYLCTGYFPAGLALAVVVSVLVASVVIGRVTDDES